jgi:hypothetical protein
MNKFREVLVASSLLATAAAAGCAPGESSPSQGSGNPMEISSSECDSDYYVAYSEDSEFGRSRYNYTLGRQDDANEFVINDDLDEATARHEDILRDVQAAEPYGVTPYSELGYTQGEADALAANSERFLNNPEDMQKALKAECAARAGKVTLSIDLLEQIVDPTIRAEEGDDAENWIAFEAEQAAQDGEFDIAQEYLPAIDDLGTNTQETARDEVERWLEFHVEQAAADSDYSRAKELAALADDKGEITEASILASI